MVDFGIFEFFGGLFFWAINGFKGKFREMKRKNYSAIVGLIFVTVLFIGFIYLYDIFLAS